MMGTEYTPMSNNKPKWFQHCLYHLVSLLALAVGVVSLIWSVLKASQGPIGPAGPAGPEVAFFGVRAFSQNAQQIYPPFPGLFPIIFEVIDYDTNHTYNRFTGYVTITEPGYYECVASVAVKNTDPTPSVPYGGNLYLTIIINGVETTQRLSSFFIVGGWMMLQGVTVEDILFLNKGDVVSFGVRATLTFPDITLVLYTSNSPVNMFLVKKINET